MDRQSFVELCGTTRETEKAAYYAMFPPPCIRNLLTELEYMVLGHCSVCAPPPLILHGDFYREGALCREIRAW